MRDRTRLWPVLAGGLLAVVLLTPGASAATPSPDDPLASVNAFLDTLIAKEFEALPTLVCADKREAVRQRFDLEAAFAEVPEGVDVAAFIDSLTVSTPDRSVTLVSSDGTTAMVAATGSIQIEADETAAREFVRQLLEAEGEDTSDATIDQLLPLVLASVEAPQDLTKTLAVVNEEGAWLLCDDFGGASPSPSPSTGPSASPAPMDPAAYEQLLATIPEPIRSSCEPDRYWQVVGLGPDPGEIAAADCDIAGEGGNYVSYSLYDSAESMDAFYDTQLQGTKNMGGLDGPGCPEGPGEGSWEHGRRFCFQVVTNDANTRWTHDALVTAAFALNDDGDWAALEALFQSAGPVAP
jgi:hypothetical protein